MARVGFVVGVVVRDLRFVLSYSAAITLIYMFHLFLCNSELSLNMYRVQYNEMPAADMRVMCLHSNGDSNAHMV